MKTSELTKAALDWAVAKCEKLDAYTDMVGVGWGVFVDYSDDYYNINYRPSENWGWAGPIIEREKIGINFIQGQWVADTTDMDDIYEQVEYGETPLVAAMRCYVASKLGDDVEVPKEVADE